MMENNIFYKNRNAIREISVKNGFPIDIACDVWRKQKGLDMVSCGEDYRKFMKLVRQYELDPHRDVREVFDD